MKIIFKYSALCFIFFAIISFTSCKKDLNEITSIALPVDDAQANALSGLTDIETAIVTDWNTTVKNLKDTIQLFRTNTNATNLSFAKNAWRKARTPWESNEAFAFGPVGTNGIDGATDSWPFDKTTFDAIINSNVPITPIYVDSMATSTKGFHAIEYLLFGVNGNKLTTDFTTREFIILGALAANLLKQSTSLKISWTKGLGSFADEFANAGKGSSTYLSTKNALAEVVGSMVSITDELPNSKIQKPLEQQSIAFLESRFSDNSFYDYRSNIVGVNAAYLGQYKNITATASISSIIQSKNSALDNKVKTQLRLCIALMDLIPTSMNQAIFSAQLQLQELQIELNKLNVMLETDVKPLL